MFLLPAYDPTAMAMLGFGILAVLGLAVHFLICALRHCLSRPSNPLYPPVGER